MQRTVEMPEGKWAIDYIEIEWEGEEVEDLLAPLEGTSLKGTEEIVKIKVELRRLTIQTVGYPLRT
jgi:hypothetical protein